LGLWIRIRIEKPDPSKPKGFQNKEKIKKFWFEELSEGLEASPGHFTFFLWGLRRNTYMAYLSYFFITKFFQAFIIKIKKPWSRSGSGFFKGFGKV
jgi:hypothetical protein